MLWWVDRSRMVRHQEDEFGTPLGAHTHNPDGTVTYGEEERDDTGPQAQERKNWSSGDPTTFYAVRDEVYETLRAAGWQIDKSEVSRAVNDWAANWQETNSIEPGVYPSAGLVFSDPEPYIRAQRAALRSDLLPAVFQVDTPEGTVYYRNSVETGPLPVGFDAQTYESAYGLDPDLTTREQTFDLQTQAQSGPTSPDFDVQDGRVTPRPQPADIIPVMGSDFIDRLNLQAQQPPARGGGGSGRGDLAYDRAQLAEAVRDRWRVWLREEPPNADAIAGEFINDANVMWKEGGAKRDFDTWIKNRMRQTPKYQTLYAHKDESQSELDYLESYLSQVEGYGFSAGVAESQLARGLSSGAAPASFAESLSVSRDAQDLGQGTFSRRFASLLSQLGPLQST